MNGTFMKVRECLSNIHNGKSIKSENITRFGMFPVYGGNGIRGYTDRSNQKGNCILVGRQGANCGNVNYIGHDIYVTEHAIVLEVNNKANPRFLAALLDQMNLGQLSSQSAQPGISGKVIEDLDIWLPPRGYQDQIGKLLESLDLKIENNALINKNLEEQAHSLYLNLFLTNRRKNWPLGKLGDLIEICYGKDHKKLSAGSIPVFGSGGFMRLVERPIYTEESVLIPRKGSLNNIPVSYTHLTLPTTSRV